MSIVWTADLNTDIDEIDNQHQRIVDYINQLENAIERQDRHSAGMVLDELADYSLSHFAFEESLQEEAGYKLAKPHKAIHEMFVKRLARYQEKHLAGEDVVKQLHGMLSTWLIHHIKRDDMAYVPDVRASIGRLAHDKTDGSWVNRLRKTFFK